MGFFKLTIRDVPLDNQTVLLRADYNIPLAKDGSISDDLRIRASLPTIEYLLHKGCKVVIISHLGRPEGVDPSLSLEPVAQRLAQLLKRDVRFVNETIGDKVYQTVKRAPSPSVIVLENLRFFPEEEADNLGFAKKLAKSSMARYFVQDGFGVVHRAHASTQAIAQCLPGVAGFLLEKEYETITHAMRSPDRPLVAVLGGAKVSDKIQVIERFVEIADTLIIGGAMANTFLAYKGYSLGKSKVETDQKETLDLIYTAARKKVGDKVDKFILLPSDLAVGTSIDADAVRRTLPISEVREDDIALDIGDKTIERYVKVIDTARTVIWNGTLGYAELPEFAHGSARLALELATHPKVMSIIGGGDTTDFALNWDGHNGASFGYVSTGGGAGLELMSGSTLPGVESLLDARR